MSTFAVRGDEIIDRKTGEPVSPAHFNEHATPEEKAQIGRDFASRGLLSNQEGDMGERDMLAADMSDDEGDTLPVSRREPDTESTHSGIPTLNEFLTVAGPRNPHKSTKELAQYWNESYGHIDPKTLPSLETFLPAAKEKNPDLSDQALTSYWDDHYGALGASEKNPIEPSNLKRGWDTGWKQLEPTAKGAIGLAGASAEKVLGAGGLATTIKDWGLKGYDEGMQQIAPLHHENDELTTVWDKVKNSGDIGALGDFVTYGLGYGASQIAQSLVIGGAGAVAGSALAGPAGTVPGAIAGVVEQAAAKGIIKNWVATAVAKRVAQGMTEQAAVKSIGFDIGGLAAMGTSAGVQEAGQIYPAAEAQAKDDGRTLTGADIAKVWGATALAAGSELIPEAYIFGNALGRFGKSLSTPRSIRALTSGATGAGLETGQEAFQTEVERAGAGQSLTDDAALKDVINSSGLALIPGLFGGTASGVVGGYKPKSIAPPEPETPKTEAEITAAITNPSLTLDQAIATAAGIVKPQPLSSTSRAGTEAFVKKEAEALREQDWHAHSRDLPILPTPESAEPPAILPGSSFTPRTTPEVDPRAAIEAERARLLEQQRTRPVEAVPSQPMGLSDLPSHAEPVKRPSQDIPVLPSATPAEPTTIQPGSAFTPRNTELPLKERIALEREKILAQREASKARLANISALVTNATRGTDFAQLGLRHPSTVKSSPGPVPHAEQAIASSLDKSYPTAHAVRKLANSYGVSPLVLNAMAEMHVGDSNLDNLSGSDLQKIAARLDAMKPAQVVQPEPVPSVKPTQPVLPLEQHTERLSTFDAAQVPRGSLVPEQNAEILARAEKAQADLDIAGNERGGRYFNETQGKGSDQEITGLKSATAQWYKEATTGPQKLSRQRGDTAVAKIIEDHGRDTGKDVQRIKELLLQDQEFTKSPFAPKDDAEWKSLIETATGTQSKIALERAAPSVEDIHALAESKGIDSESPAFHATTEEVTGTPRLDDLKASERRKMAHHLESTPFTLTATEAKKPKPKAPEQQSIPVPAETIGSRPIIGREVAPEDAPLFSKSAQLPEAEQTALPETVPEPAKEPAEPAPLPSLNLDAIPAGVKVNVKGIRESTGEDIQVKEDAKTALHDLDASLKKYQQLLECLSA